MERSKGQSSGFGLPAHPVTMPTTAKIGALRNITGGIEKKASNVADLLNYFPDSFDFSN